MPKLGDTLPEALRFTAERGVRELVFHLEEEGTVRMSLADLAERAGQGARALAARGVKPGDVVGVLGPNRPEWVIWAWATWSAGATLVPLQIPLRVRDPGSFAEAVRSLVAAAGCRLVLADPRLVSSLPEETGVSWDVSPESEGDDPPWPDPDQGAVIQFTSGSTAQPKGALVTHRAIVAQMHSFEAWLGSNLTDEVLVGWVPFFHDLGLFMNVVTPGAFGVTCHYLPTERFAADPAEWLRLLTSTGATWSHSPPSAIGHALRAAARQPDRIDLGAMRFLYLGAEGIDADVWERLLAGAERLRLAPGAVGAGYGLAEAVLAVSSTRPGEGLHFDQVDLAELAASERALPANEGPVRRIASCGRPAPGTEVRIVCGGTEVPERQVGEIHVRGPSLMRGYIGKDAPDPFVDGWLSTGDLGYLADGDLYITGRMKDVVIVMGHNYYPEDFEWGAGRLPGVRAGRCVAFGDGSDSGVVLLVEPSAGADPEALLKEVRNAVTDSVGISPGDVLVLPRGTVEKTTSGKLRRSTMRDAYLQGELRPLAHLSRGRP